MNVLALLQVLQAVSLKRDIVLPTEKDTYRVYFLPVE